MRSQGCCHLTRRQSVGERHYVNVGAARLALISLVMHCAYLTIAP